MRLPHWLTRSRLDPPQPAPKEIISLRLIGVGILLAYVVVACVNDPRPALTGEGLRILLGTVAFVAVAIVTVPLTFVGGPTRIAGVVALTVLAAVLVQLQPDGLWVVTPYLVASVCAMLLPSRIGAVAFVVSTVIVLGAAVLADRGSSAAGIGTGVVPWFLFMRVLRRVREEHEVTKGLLRELEASRAAEAAAAAENERARVARELHDVLAHSLSALALQLESTRLLAADRGADAEVVDGIGRAHGIAASGLDEARRAIGAMRGEDLPGPDKLPALVEAFEAHTQLPCELVVDGAPRSLPGDARLAIYRTAQEALTNVRRHASDARAVRVALAWEAECVRLVVADRTPQPVPALPSGGYGLTGMRERAELLGGRLTAGPAADGFRVELELPA